jgi:hypothetical protein
VNEKPKAIPPHANASTHDVVMAKLRKMTPTQIAAVAAKVGIYDGQGKLTKEYGGSSDTKPDDV